MKCAACGYEFEHDWVDNKRISGDEEFLRVQGSFTIKDNDYMLKEIGLYVCPKCGTVKMERWE